MLKGFDFDFNNIFLVQWDRWMVGWLASEWLWFHNDTKRILLLLKMLFFCEKLISIDILRSLMPEAP